MFGMKICLRTSCVPKVRTIPGSRVDHPASSEHCPVEAGGGGEGG